MRTRKYTLLWAITGLILITAMPAWAACNPSSTSQVSCLGGPDKECTTLGTTTMDKDQKNIMACLLDDSGVKVWKRMSGRVGVGTPWKSGEFYEDTEGTYVGAACPTGKVMTEVHTINVGMGGHNYWYIICQ